MVFECYCIDDLYIILLIPKQLSLVLFSSSVLNNIKYDMKLIKYFVFYVFAVCMSLHGNLFSEYDQYKMI